jgi:hypothetical protein
MRRGSAGDGTMKCGKSDDVSLSPINIIRVKEEDNLWGENFPSKGIIEDVLLEGKDWRQKEHAVAAVPGTRLVERSVCGISCVPHLLLC